MRSLEQRLRRTGYSTVGSAPSCLEYIEHSKLLRFADATSRQKLAADPVLVNKRFFPAPEPLFRNGRVQLPEHSPKCLHQ
jgi:hypothetical protein